MNTGRLLQLVWKAQQYSEGFVSDDDSHVIAKEALDELEVLLFDLHHGPIPEGPRCPDCDAAARIVDVEGRRTDAVRECTECGATWQVG